MSASVYDFSASRIDGARENLSVYKDRALLIVNTASQCGFTPQYRGLETLYRSYKDKGFAVLGFPCNQFGAQEPGDAAEIQNFCRTDYDVTFPLFAKIDVNGENAHPLYRFLKSEAPGVLGSRAIKWNFTKFLVGREGQVTARYAPQTEPAKLARDIEAVLERAS